MTDLEREGLFIPCRGRFPFCLRRNHTLAEDYFSRDGKFFREMGSKYGRGCLVRGGLPQDIPKLGGDFCLTVHGQGMACGKSFKNELRQRLGRLDQVSDGRGPSGVDQGIGVFSLVEHGDRPLIPSARHRGTARMAALTPAASPSKKMITSGV